MTDQPKVGPTGEFPFGKPVDPTDRGGLYMRFGCVKAARHCVLEFGTPVEYVNGTLPEIAQLVNLMRQKVLETWGMMTYNKHDLKNYIQVSIVHGNLVQIVMPTRVEILACNPEVVLSLCEVIEDRVREAGLSLPM